MITPGTVPAGDVQETLTQSRNPELESDVAVPPAEDKSDIPRPPGLELPPIPMELPEYFNPDIFPPDPITIPKSSDLIPIDGSGVAKDPVFLKNVPSADPVIDDTGDSITPFVPIAEAAVHKTPAFLAPIGIATAAVAGLLSFFGVVGVHSFVSGRWGAKRRGERVRERRHVRDWNVEEVY